MNNIKKFALAVLVLLGCINASAQQKIAHVNSNDIITQMSDFKIADMVLDSLKKAKSAEFDLYQAEFLKKKEAYSALNPATTSEATMKMKEKELSDMKDRIQQFSEDAQAEIQNKQAELYDPIQKKLLKVIEQVAKEKGYTYVMDDQALLVKPESDDITSAVKIKLGIVSPTPTPTPTPAQAPKK